MSRRGGVKKTKHMQKSVSNLNRLFCLFQRKRKLEELSRQLEESQQKRKVTEQLIAKAKVGREASVSNSRSICKCASEH